MDFQSVLKKKVKACKDAREVRTKVTLLVEDIGLYTGLCDITVCLCVRIGLRPRSQPLFLFWTRFSLEGLQGRERSQEDESCITSRRDEIIYMIV